MDQSSTSRVEFAPTLWSQLAEFAADIKLSHSVFALPFAVLASFLAAGGWPGVGKMSLIVVCMVLLRSFAMGMNRLLDARLDKLNPRTARRSIPAGRLRATFVAGVLSVCAAGFVAATTMFGLWYGNWLPLWCSIPVLGFVGAYPLLKRYTRLVHYYLGAALGLAPVCAWIAIAGGQTTRGLDQTFLATGQGDPFMVALLLGAAVLFWTAGFDIIYACQDFDSDQQTGVFSVPASLGVQKALWVSRGSHLLSVSSLLAAGLVSSLLGTVWVVAVGLIVLLLVYEHSLVKPNDLSKVNLAFFTINGCVSLTLGALGIVDVYR